MVPSVGVLTREGKMPVNYNLILQQDGELYPNIDWQTDLTILPFPNTDPNNPQYGPGTLSQGFGLYSPQQAFRLYLEPLTGNLVLQRAEDDSLGPQTGAPMPPTGITWTTIWSAEATGNALIIGIDGSLNLCQLEVSDAGMGTGTVEGPTQTFYAGDWPATAGAYLRMQDDGNAVLYGPAGNKLWASGTDARR
jgi:hypothetical protein